ncbi:MAG: hypothetical protein NT013_07955 [Planctomycetia bacterium]|nr:hypothetical protein [Planctomycetia bacterium]
MIRSESETEATNVAGKCDGATRETSVLEGNGGITPRDWLQ